MEHLQDAWLNSEHWGSSDKTNFLHLSCSRVDKLYSDQTSMFENILSDCGVIKKWKEIERRERKGCFNGYQGVLFQGDDI